MVSYWSFEEGSGDIVNDGIPNGNDGIIYGAEWNIEQSSSSEYISGTSFTLQNDLIDNSEYFWQVTAEDQSGATYDYTFTIFCS